MKVLKELVFDEDQDGVFVILFDGLIFGGSQGQARSREKLRDEARAQRALMTISDPLPKDQLDARMRPPNARVLKAKRPQRLRLEVVFIELLQEYIAKVSWPGHQVLDVDDAYDLLATAPEVKEGEEGEEGEGERARSKAAPKLKKAG